MVPSPRGTDSTTLTIFRRPVAQASFETPRERRRSNSSSDSPPNLSQRRSVASMKGLMPLRLSSSCSSLASGTPSEGGMGAEAEEYFPEQLVKDLEMSSAMFAAKNLTAGVPLSSSFVDDKGRLRPSLFPYRRATSPGFHSGSLHIPSLGPIEERESIVSFLNQRGYQEDTTDGDSLADSEESGGMIPPSIPLRDQSIVTAATSLVSAGNIPSPKGSLPRDNSRVYSWIEADSDMEDLDLTADDKVGFLSPRPPTPPESDNSLGAVTGVSTKRQAARQAKQSLHRRSQSLVTGAPSNLPQRRLSGRSASGKLQSTPPPRTAQPDFHHSTTTFGGSGWTARQSSPSAHAVMQTPLSDPMDLDAMSSLPSLVPDTNPRFGYNIDSDEEDSLYPIASPPTRTQRSEVYIRPSPPPSPPPTVERLLNGSAQAFVTPPPLDDGPRAVPLPPEIVETLRVSVTCFPETMLLTSSLTLETIRAYAKKVRHPHLGSIKLPSPNTTPTRMNTGKSLWRKVSSYRRGGRFRDESSEVDVVPEPPKPWMAVKNIFGDASDYICDALYAHIVAYNYISSLVPPQPGIAVTPSSPVLTRHDDIPKKAASLLGLSPKDSGQDGPGTPRTSRPVSSWRRGGRPNSQSASPTQEATLRDIQGGLTRCVMGLVATARTMAEEDGKGIGKGLVVLEGRASDEYLMRSLVEVVRLSEEMS